MVCHGRAQSVRTTVSLSPLGQVSVITLVWILRVEATWDTRSIKESMERIYSTESVAILRDAA